MIYGAAELALRATVLLAVCWAAAWALEKAGLSAARQYAVWLSGFTALALLPLCTWLLPSVPVPILPAAPPAASHVAAAAPMVGQPESAKPNVAWLLQLLYLGISALLLARILAARLVLERLWQGAAPLRDPKLIEQAAAISTSLGIRRRIAIRLADGDMVPMTWGSISPRILLPSEALRWTDERCRSVLLHELGHVSRHDSLSRLAVEAICALYWLHPGMWLAARRLRLVQEQACDDLALTNGAPAFGYARELLDSAAPNRRAALAMASTDLEQRLRSILGEGRRDCASKTFLGSSALLTIGTAWLISVTVPVPAVSAVQSVAEPELRFVPKSQGSRMDLPAAMHPRGARPISADSPTRSAEHRTSPIVAASRPLTDDYDAQLAQYRNDVLAYGAAVQRYDRELDDYSAANEEYGRKVAAYRQRMAEIGPDPPPGTVLPTYPTAPTAPTAPVEPVQPLTRSH